MNAFSLIATALLCAAAARAADAEPAVKLTGIAFVGTRAVALLELKDIAGTAGRTVLGVGDRIPFGELVSINPKSATASVRIGDQVLELSLDSAFDSEPSPTLHFKEADSRQLLELYQVLSGRTLLSSPSLRASRISLKSQQALGKEASLEMLASALREKGIVVTLRSDKFAFATPISQVPRLAQIPDPPAPVKASTENKDEKFQPGLLKFMEADIHPVLDIYQELCGRTLLVSPELPPAKITVASQTSLTRDEMVWLLDAMLYLAGTKLVPERTQFTYALPATHNVKGPKIPDNPAADKLMSSKRSLAPATLNLSQGTALQALALYAELLGRQPLTNASTSPARFTLRSQTALQPVEAIYALDALAELNHLRFVLVGDKQVKIVHAFDAGKPAGNN